jgi:hypothetical protein
MRDEEGRTCMRGSMPRKAVAERCIDSLIVRAANSGQRRGCNIKRNNTAQTSQSVEVVLQADPKNWLRHPISIFVARYMCRNLASQQAQRTSNAISKFNKQDMCQKKRLT